VKKRTGTNSQADNIFIRNSRGQIIGVNESKLNKDIPMLEGLNETPPDIAGRYHRYNKSYLVPSTTGSADHKKTSNGIYLVNEKRSDSHLATSVEAPMSFQTYIDTVYADGQESGIAIHGTPTRFHHLLGTKRASHGCARVHPTHAKIIRNFMESLQQRPVPKPKWKEWVSFESQPSPLAPEKVMRIPVLFVIFNGYGGSQITNAYNNLFNINIWQNYASN
jgi:hypothetical protein